MTTPQVAPLPIDLTRRQGPLPQLPTLPQNAKAARRTQLAALVPQDVPIQLIHFFPDNHNEQDERTFAGECESLLRFGMVDPCLVRPFDEADLAAGIGEPGGYEMIDGEHRTRSIFAWMEKGLPEGAHKDLVYLCQQMVVPCLVQPMSRAWAARLRIVLSETRGRSNAVKLGKVLSQLVDSVGLEELRVGTPWTVEHVREIVEVGKFDWEAFERAAAERKAGAKSEATGTVKVTIECPKSAQDQLHADMRPLIEKHGLRVKVAKK